MRVRKDPDTRRLELLNTATALFTSVGYTKTTVTDIVKKAGVAKGTFFYYFPTKEAVLETLFQHSTAELIASFHAETRQAAPLEKLQHLLDLLLQPSALDDICDVLLAEDQLSLLYKLWSQQGEQQLNSLLTDILTQCQAAGITQLDALPERLPFFWNILNCFWESIYLEESTELINDKLRVAESLLEHLFKLPAGSLTLSLAQGY